MPHIDSYRFKQLVIDGHLYSKDVIILPGESVIEPWWRESSHNVLIQDLTQYIREFPPKLIIGTGRFGMMKVPDKTKDWLKEQHIEISLAKTDQACKLYNQSDLSTTGVALHLTC